MKKILLRCKGLNRRCMGRSRGRWRKSPNVLFESLESEFWIQESQTCFLFEQASFNWAAVILTKQRLTILNGTGRLAGSEVKQSRPASAPSQRCCSDQDLIVGDTAMTVKVSLIKGLNQIMWHCFSGATAFSATFLDLGQLSKLQTTLYQEMVLIWHQMPTLLNIYIWDQQDRRQTE